MYGVTLLQVFIMLFYHQAGIFCLDIAKFRLVKVPTVRNIGFLL